MYQRRFSARKGDQKLEVQVGGNEDELQIKSARPDVVEARGAAGLVDDADRHLHQFMQRQPEILRMSLLREVEGEQKYRKEQEQDGNHEAWKTLKQRADRPQIELSSKSAG